MCVNLLLVIINFGMSFKRRLLALALLHRGRLLAGTRLSHATLTGIAVLTVTLLRLITTRFHVGQRRSDEFPIHDNSSKMIINKDGDPELALAVCSQKQVSRRLRPPRRDAH